MSPLQGFPLVLAVFRTPISPIGADCPAEIRAVLLAQGTANKVHRWILSECDDLIATGEEVNNARYLAAMTCFLLGAQFRPALLEYLAPLIEQLETTGDDGVLQTWSPDVVFSTSPIDLPQVRTTIGLYRTFAEALEGEGYYIDAERYFRRALELGPAMAATWIGVAENLRKQNRLAEAIALIESARLSAHYLAPLSDTSILQDPPENPWDSRLTAAKIAQDNHEMFVNIIEAYHTELREKLERGYVFRAHKKYRDRGRFRGPVSTAGRP